MKWNRASLVRVRRLVAMGRGWRCREEVRLVRGERVDILVDCW